MIILQAMTRPVVNVGKPSVFSRLFQAAVDIRIKQKLPKATARSCRRPPLGLRMSIAAAFSTGRFVFSFLVLFSFINEFSLWKTGRVALGISHPTGSTVEGDFRARSAREVERMLR